MPRLTQDDCRSPGHESRCAATPREMCSEVIASEQERSSVTRPGAISSRMPSTGLGHPSAAIQDLLKELGRERATFRASHARHHCHLMPAVGTACARRLPSDRRPRTRGARYAREAPRADRTPPGARSAGRPCRGLASRGAANMRRRLTAPHLTPPAMTRCRLMCSCETLAGRNATGGFWAASPLMGSLRCSQPDGCEHQRSAVNGVRPMLQP